MFIWNIQLQHKTKNVLILIIKVNYNEHCSLSKVISESIKSKQVFNLKKKGKKIGSNPKMIYPKRHNLQGHAEDPIIEKWGDLTIFISSWITHLNANWFLMEPICYFPPIWKFSNSMALVIISQDNVVWPNKP